MLRLAGDDKVGKRRESRQGCEIRQRREQRGVAEAERERTPGNGGVISPQIQIEIWRRSRVCWFILIVVGVLA